MTMKRIHAFGAVLAVALLAGSAVAQGIDPADVTFWQSIQSSQNPAEYEVYLQAFPNGTFAELARLRITQLSGGQAPAPAPVPAPGPAATIRPVGPAPTQAAGGMIPSVQMTITPSAPRVGDVIKASFAGVPNATASDLFVVVDAGAPDSAGTINQEGVVTSTYSNEYYRTNGWEIGQLAPGAYELRWVTKLYNNAGRMELKARAPFEVGF